MNGMGLGRLAVRFSIAAALLLGSFQGSAEPRTGSLIDRTPGQVRPTEWEDSTTPSQVALTFSGCLARANPKWAAVVLELAYMSQDQAKEVSREVGGLEDCLGASGMTVRIGPMAIVGGMAVAMIDQKFRRTDVAYLGTFTDESSEKAGLVPRNAYEDMGQCIVRSDPAAARDFVRAVPGSDAEARAAAQVGPHVGPCLLAGQSLSLKYDSLRALLATSLYRALSVTQAHN